MSAEGQKQIKKKTKRVRAHSHPLADAAYRIPNHPLSYDWSPQYPKMLPLKENSSAIELPSKEVTIADIGSGFGGLLLSLSSEFKDELILGLEIRQSAVDITTQYIDDARANNKVIRPDESEHDWDARNIAVLNSNIMKFAPNLFMKGQLTKMFILFADPHFKNSKHRLRVINPTYLDIYAHFIAIGGILYTISDVEDLYLWQKKHLDEHPLFERIPDEEMKDDVCFELIHTGTHEGLKVSRNGGNKYPACYRRIEFNPENDQTNKQRIGLLE
jgi:tRNA (guanine-N7-)-methyltransferase